MRPECTTTTTNTNLNACGDSFYEKGGEETKEGERGERERGKRTSGDDGGTQIKLKCPHSLGMLLPELLLLPQSCLLLLLLLFPLQSPRFSCCCYRCGHDFCLACFWFHRLFTQRLKTTVELQQHGLIDLILDLTRKNMPYPFIGVQKPSYLLLRNICTIQ